MVKILILCALKVELQFLQANFSKIIEKGEYPFKFFFSDYKNLKIISAKCGLGKIRSASFTQYAIDNLDFDLIVNFGSCGQIDENVTIGDLIFCTETIEYDFYTVRDFIPRFKVNHNIPEEYFDKFCIKKGILLTATQNIDSKAKKQYLKNTFNGTVGDWEGAAISQVSTLNKKKFFIFKTITDRGEENLIDDYKKSFEEVLEKNSKKMLDFLSFLSQKECL